MLVVLDAIFNAATAAQLRKIRKQLADGAELVEIYAEFEKTVSKKIRVTENEKEEHFVGDWLTTWWPKLKIESELRKGIIRVIDVQLEKRPARKVDYFWIPTATDSFQVVPCPWERRVVAIILSPEPPRPARGARRS